MNLEIVETKETGGEVLDESKAPKGIHALLGCACPKPGERTAKLKESKCEGDIHIPFKAEVTEEIEPERDIDDNLKRQPDQLRKNATVTLSVPFNLNGMKGTVEIKASDHKAGIEDVQRVVLEAIGNEIAMARILATQND